MSYPASCIAGTDEGLVPSWVRILPGAAVMWAGGLPFCFNAGSFSEFEVKVDLCGNVNACKFPLENTSECTYKQGVK